MRAKPVHYVECHCGAGRREDNESCDCGLLCNQWTEFAETTGVRRWVSCKNCKRILQAAERRKEKC